MAVFNISDQDLAFIREQATGASQTPEQYLLGLARAEWRRRAKAELEAKLLEGINSGPATEWTAEDLDAMRREVLEEAARREAP
jgi:antitoxin ParD1/3/4